MKGRCEHELFKGHYWSVPELFLVKAKIQILNRYYILHIQQMNTVWYQTIGHFLHDFWDYLRIFLELWYFFFRILGFFWECFILSSAKKSDVLSWLTYQPTMSDFRPIIINLPTYLKSDVINGRSLKGNLP